MLNNTKSRWVIWSDYKTDWKNKNKTQISNDKGNNIQQLTESIKCMRNKVDQFNY